MINEVRSIPACPPHSSMRQVLVGLIRGVLGIGSIAWLTQRDIAIILGGVNDYFFLYLYSS